MPPSKSDKKVSPSRRLQRPAAKWALAKSLLEQRELSLDEIAHRIGVTPRQLARKMAQSLLDNGEMSIGEIAHHVGWTRRQLMRKIQMALKQGLVRRRNKRQPINATA